MVLTLALLIALSVPGQEAVPTPAGQSSAASLSPQDIAQLRAKAESGDPQAQVKLGAAYEDGNGVKQNYADAAQWYRKAADEANSEGQNDLGLMYYMGHGVDKDRAEAAKWYEKAARQKNPRAMFNLGAAYYNGDGVAENNVIGYAWFLLAYEAGNQLALDPVNRMPTELKPFQVADVYAYIAQMYEKGTGLPQDDKEAFRWYQKAAQNGDPELQVRVAMMLLSGKASEQHPGEARQLCEDAAKKKFGPAATCVGLIYENGIDAPKDSAEAAKWFRVGAEALQPIALLHLGEMYWKGTGVKQDRIMAYQFVFLAASTNLTQAAKDKDEFEKSLTTKEISKAKKQAEQWAIRYRPLSLRVRAN